MTSAVFIAIAFAGLVLLIGGSIFGHDHDHDFGHGFDPGDGGAEPTASIFSTKVIAMFIIGFGAAGFVARYHNSGPEVASLWGVACGLLLGFVMYLILRLIYSQQSNSLASSTGAVGHSGVVTIGIDPGHIGEVEVTMGSLQRTYQARAEGPSGIAKGSTIEVVKCQGGQVVVKQP